MSAENSIAKGGRDLDVQGEPNGLDLPPEVQARYDVRLVDQPGSSEPRIGLFAPNDRINPAIEISGDRIVANREDAETIDSLVQIAKHNGWDSIDVDGSPEFRKAMWAAATREGLAVKGYEPSFVEHEKAASDRREREAKAAPAAPAGKPGRDADATVSPAPPDQGVAPPAAATADQGAAVERGAAALAAMGPLLEERRTLRTRFDRSSELPDDKFSNLIDARAKNEDALRETWATVLMSPDYARRIEADGNSVEALEASGRRGRWQEDVEGVLTQLREAEPAPQLSDEDSRLLLKVSALTEDRKALYGNLREDMDPLAREVQYERIDLNRGALNTALEEALESPGVVKAFNRAGYQSDGLRELGRGGEWDGEIADAIYLVRSGLDRDEVAKETVAAFVSADREYQASSAAPTPADRRPETDVPLVRQDREHSARERNHENNELAELFLHGAEEVVARDPRLAGAREVQALMEEHIGEVFRGDAAQMTSANQESRQMISDALRRGLDVSVRVPEPVRMIEPMQTRPDLER